jgi:polar amino acid transport system permease protein
MGFDLEFALSLVPSILKASLTTVWITLASSALAMVLGFALEIVRSLTTTTRRVMTLVIDFLRVTPILALMYFMYFVLPYYGVELPAALVGILTLALHYAGYLAEVFKAAIKAIPPGQTEAAQALGLRRAHTMLLVLLPQVLRNAAPAASNYVLSILKSTPYLAVLAVPEMLSTALDQAAQSFRYVEPMAVVGLLFLMFCFATGRAIDYFHRRLRSRDA